MSQGSPVFRPWLMRPMSACTAVVCALLTLTPSLLPRTALFQSVLWAVVALLGYGVGTLISWLIDTARKDHEHVRYRVQTPLVLVFALVLGSGLWLYHRWQRQQRDALGMEGEPF